MCFKQLTGFSVILHSSYSNVFVLSAIASGKMDEAGGGNETIHRSGYVIT
jgi:hypothetical protein